MLKDRDMDIEREDDKYNDMEELLDFSNVEREQERIHKVLFRYSDKIVRNQRCEEEEEELGSDIYTCKRWKTKMKEE